jgi:hypothetical protein
MPPSSTTTSFYIAAQNRVKCIKMLIQVEFSHYFRLYTVRTEEYLGYLLSSYVSTLSSKFKKILFLVSEAPKCEKS